MFINDSMLFVLNKTLSNNESSLNSLKQHIYKSFKINFLGLSLSAVINQDGVLSRYSETEFTVIINIPITASTYLINQNKIDLFKQLTFIGDKKFGRELLEILSKLNSYGLFSTQSSFANILVNQLINLIKMIIAQIKLTSTNASQSISQYLLYETEDIADKYEIDKFCNAVDDVKARVELLNQRINLLVTK